MVSVAQVQQRALIIIWALDHALLAIFTLGHCKPYEMISSALWDLELHGKAFGHLRPVVDFALRPLGKDHCQRSWEWQRDLYISCATKQSDGLSSA